jgi:orotate phosphoribosyltransferase
MEADSRTVGGEMAMDDRRHRFLEILRHTSFQATPEPSFRLASGQLSKYYVDCKQVLSDPEARALIAELICDRLGSESIHAVGGLEIGAYPIATSVSDAIYRRAGIKVRAFVVRKQPKTHGIRDLIAGDVRQGDKVLIVDDVVTEGNSTLNAIRVARSAGLSVERVIVLVDREESDGRKNIENAGVKFEALCTLRDLIELPDDANKGEDRHVDQRGVV